MSRQRVHEGVVDDESRESTGKGDVTLARRGQSEIDRPGWDWKIARLMTTPVAYISGSVPVDIFFTTAPRYYAALQALHTHEPRRGETAAVTSAARHPNEAISSDARAGSKMQSADWLHASTPLSNLGAEPRGKLCGVGDPGESSSGRTDWRAPRRQAIQYAPLSATHSASGSNRLRDICNHSDAKTTHSTRLNHTTRDCKYLETTDAELVISSTSFRPHGMLIADAVYYCRRNGVVCLSDMYWSRPCAQQKRMDRSACRLAADAWAPTH